MKLNDLFLTKSRAAVLLGLFGLNAEEIHLRAIQRTSGLSIRAIQLEVERLLRHDLILERRDGNRRYFSANRSHPLFADLHSIVLKTSGLVEVLREGLGTDGIEVAFVFGSVARNEERSHSDVDVFIIASIGLREVATRLLGATETVGREINPHVYPVDEFRERWKSNDSFLERVMGSNKLFIVGSEDELARLGT